MKCCNLSKTIALAMLLFTAACASSQKYNSGSVPPVDDGEYGKVLDKFSRLDRQYNGFYQTYEVQGTLHNSEVNRLVLQKTGFHHQWDSEQVRKERERSMQDLSSESSFFFSFFTPERETNDLNKGTTIWKVYLESGGVRYDGRVVRRNDKLADLRAVYPYHNRWSVPYKVYFKIPMAVVEQADCKIVFTSSLGTTTFQFPSVK